MLADSAIVSADAPRRAARSHPRCVPWFEARRVAYQDALLTLSITGDLNAWIAFFATGVEAAADTSHRRVDGLLAWQEGGLRRVRGPARLGSTNDWPPTSSAFRSCVPARSPTGIA
jgi:hypothetical protein